MAAKIYGGRWEVVRPLREGGQAHVFLVKDRERNGKECALKRLKNPARKDRFVKEIQAASKVDSPYVSKIIEYAIAEEGSKDHSYYVMPFYGDQTLEDWLGGFKSKPLDALHFFRKVCLGVKSAHSSSPPVYHRDLKPANILISEEGDPIVADFGLCYVEQGERLTSIDEAVGSKHFIAPECEDGRTDLVGPATDVYLLGKILYAMVSGGVTFAREKHREAEFDLVNITANPRTEYISEMLDRCICSDATKRFPDVGHLLDMVGESIRLLEDRFHPVNRKKDLCRFCGRAEYVPIGYLEDAWIRLPRGKKHLTNMANEGRYVKIWACPECRSVDLELEGWRPEDFGLKSI